MIFDQKKILDLRLFFAFLFFFLFLIFFKETLAQGIPRDPNGCVAAWESSPTSTILIRPGEQTAILISNVIIPQEYIVRIDSPPGFVWFVALFPASANPQRFVITAPPAELVYDVLVVHRLVDGDVFCENSPLTLIVSSVVPTPAPTPAPYTTPPYATPPYATPPYATPPYATPPYATPPYATPPYATPPYATPPYATPPYLTPPYATPPYATPPYATPPYLTPPGQEAVNIGIIPGLPNFTLAQAVTLVIRLLFIIAFGLLLIVFLYGGIRWIASAGDVKAISGAQHLLTAAIVGIIIVIASFALIRLIEFLFKVSIISAPLNVPQI